MSGTGAVSQSKMPVPLGVNGETGLAKPALGENDLQHMGLDPELVAHRFSKQKVLGLAGSVDDAMDLTETGWGVIFASDADPRIKEQLQSLLALRQKQVQDSKLFHIFEGEAGVLPGETAASWATRHGVGLIAPVDPGKGVPYYLLIVGSPARIPFEFQALLDLQWAVGRLHFDEIEDYGRYAQKVVEYEDESFRPPQQKNAAAWLTRNPLDIATAMLSGAITGDFLDPDAKFGKRQQFGFAAFSAEQATKRQLEEILRGNISGGPPAIVFTGSHGAEWPMTDPVKQRRLQGALVTQEWSKGMPLDDSNQFSADDIPADAKLQGMIAFLFACYGGGCPAQDNYFFNKDGLQIPVAPEPLIARLPQALLSRGTLAVIAHIDRAFTYTFEDIAGTSQVQVLRTPLELLMKGKRVGFAADTLNLQWSTLAAQLGVALGGNAPNSPSPRSPVIANLFIARDDARNYVVLGDPAVRLRTGSLS